MPMRFEEKTQHLTVKQVPMQCHNSPWKTKLKDFLIKWSGKMSKLTLRLWLGIGDITHCSWQILNY